MANDNLLRVAHVIGNISEGGIEVMMTNFYRNIDHSQVVFDFIVPNTSVVLNKEEIESYGGKVFIVPSVKKIFSYKKALKKIFSNNHYDIVHASMNALSFIPLKAAKKCDIPVRISHSHSTSHKKEHFRHIIKSMLRPFSKKYATHYFACSEKAGRWLFGNKVVNEGNVYYINNGIDLNKFKFDETKRSFIRNELDIGDLSLLGHIGRFAPQKNHPYLIKIFEDISKINPNVGLLMVGSGQDLEKIKKDVEVKGLKNIFFIGPVSNPNDYYQAMDCFVLPSLYEGLPVVGVEAQANGLKCFFSSEVTPEAKLLQETEFLSIKENSKVWAEEINKYLTARNALRISNIQLEKYDINNISAYMLSLYKIFVNEQNK